MQFMVVVSLLYRFSFSGQLLIESRQQTSVHTEKTRWVKRRHKTI
jgi:hypothetical protein